MVYVQRCLVVTWLVPRETAAVSARSVYTTQPCTMSRHSMRGRIRSVHTCLAVTCHLDFLQNRRDLLRAAAVTLGWNGYKNKSQHKQIDPREENYPAAPVGTRTRDLSITSPAL